MKNINDRISYIKGLVSECKFDENSKEGLIFNELLNLIEELSSNVEETQEELEEYVDSIDNELLEIKRDFYNYDDLDEELKSFQEEFDDENSEVQYEEVSCSSCSEVIYIDKDIIDDGQQILCPCCHNIILNK